MGVTEAKRTRAIYRCKIFNTLPDDIPKVVEDAITVTKTLSWRYLWVDRYCIDQQDEVHKNDQINNMDKIYKGATVTLVAAAGIDDSFGLPGIGGTCRALQPYAVVKRTVLASTLCDPEYSIHDTTWSTRAWTYQEGVLSNRRLVFTEQQIYFECKNMHCCEAIRKPLDILHRKRGRQGLRANVRRGYIENHCGLSGTRRYDDNADPCDSICNKFTQLRSHLERFTGRNLSHASDSINAFMGILREYASQEPVIHHYYGLPLNHPWEDSPVAAFTVSLTWVPDRRLNKRPVRRRHGFPSFSWAGWVGVVRLPDNSNCASFHSHIPLLNDSETSLLLASRHDQLTRLDDVGPSDLPCYLHVEGNVFQIQLMFVPKVAGVNIAPYNYYSTGYQLAHAGNLIQSVKLDLSGSPLRGDETLDALKTKQWECLILGESRSTTIPSFHLMLIEWSGDVAERFGIVTGGPKLAELVARIPQVRRKIKIG